MILWEKKEGRMAFFILIPLGIFSVFYWQYTESLHQGDLRFYAFVQFFPMLIVPFIIWLFPKKVIPTSNTFFYVLGWYILAKICEYYDDVIFDFTTFWSGHTIKHLLSAICLVYVLKVLVAWEKELIRTT